jgi:hypothetical protein
MPYEGHFYERQKKSLKVEAFKDLKMSCLGR